MKLSFSTRGWQHLSWDELLVSAEESGMNGIELYDLFKRGDLIDRACPFDRYRAATTVRQLREKGRSRAWIPLSTFHSRKRASRM